VHLIPLTVASINSDPELIPVRISGLILVGSGRPPDRFLVAISHFAEFREKRPVLDACNADNAE